MPYPSITATKDKPFKLGGSLVNARLSQLTLDDGGYIEVSADGKLIIDELVIKSVTEPTIRVYGVDATPYLDGKHGSDGWQGRVGDRGTCLTVDVAGGEGANGGTAGNAGCGRVGQSGLNGADAPTVIIDIKAITNTNSIDISVESRGGSGANGSKGGAGGTGGAGGNGGIVQPCGTQHCNSGLGGNGGNGGNGANGGAGGNGGNGGDVTVYVPKSNTGKVSAELKVSNLGLGGRGGLAGQGGAGGIDGGGDGLGLGSTPGMPGKTVGTNGNDGTSGAVGKINITEV
ncbi:hypothetical protein BJAS_P3474 [Bathymodiolus japonicus methanotrophic gill symbiont]|uniref:hypothetical protein n=1 Tax=Bathymodiolus japonicus methanotrophic gill symbiont TaxID=113269 RepID=UPI001B6C960B|nr:hypothetical protein [Bathymodiolus japonicus methanotrophic gill symbiont]GFO72937.1 hypothetical protein BJAS_P3474 [Bathymodiolus japonicus methanotrophic gill symbiont]